MRQLIVWATNPKGNTVEVSILTDDFIRSAEGCIKLMFSRWVQENDFRYLERHFGINQITTYQSISYWELEANIEDKQVLSEQYKALNIKTGKLNSELKNLLLREYKSKKPNINHKERIEELSRQLQQIEEEKAKTQKQESKLQSLINQGYRRLNTDNKLVMDYIKIIARNIFYLSLEPFKKDYNNYRDDHVLFRNLTRAHGFLSREGNQLTAALFPTANLQPKVFRIMEVFLEKINQSQPVVLGDPKHRIKLKLTKQSINVFAIQ